MEPTAENYLRGLREDHARFSRVLSMVGRDAQRLLDEPEAVLPLLSEAVDYVVHFQNIHHHPREEIMFAKVAKTSESLAAAATRLSQEHELTDRAGEELLATLQRASRSASERSARRELARQLEGFARSMRAHIAQEEEILYAEAWETLSSAEWADLAASAPDPLDRAQDGRYPLLADYVRAGQTQSTVQLDSGAIGEAVESGIEQLSSFVRQFGAVTATARRQRREAFELILESVRDMTHAPLLRPRQTLTASAGHAHALADAYVRWLREWRDVLRTSDDARASGSAAAR